MAATRQLTQQVSDIITNDPGIIKVLANAVSELIVKKIVESEDIIAKITEKVTKEAAFVESITTKLDESLSHDYAQLQEKHETLEKAIETLSNQHQDLKWEIDSLEQYGQRNCLLFHNIPEPAAGLREDTDAAVMRIINNKLGFQLDASDLDRSHRLGRRGSNPAGSQVNADGATSTPKPRPIIAKFLSYNIRSEVFRSKRALKGSGIGISESLTQIRMELYKLVSNHSNVNSAWTQDGRIVALLKSNKKKVTVETNKDLFKLAA